jgi:hypothetical protein
MLHVIINAGMLSIELQRIMCKVTCLFLPPSSLTASTPPSLTNLWAVCTCQQGVTTVAAVAAVTVRKHKQLEKADSQALAHSSTTQQLH